MTPTYQDKELREQLKKYNWSSDKDYQIACIAFKDITADKRRVALEARLDELRKMSDLPYIGLRAKRLERLGNRAAELKQGLEQL